MPFVWMVSCFVTTVSLITVWVRYHRSNHHFDIFASASSPLELSLGLLLVLTEFNLFVFADWSYGLLPRSGEVLVIF